MCCENLNLNDASQERLQNLARLHTRRAVEITFGPQINEILRSLAIRKGETLPSASHELDRAKVIKEVYRERFGSSLNLDLLVRISQEDGVNT